ncbi:amidohydrolase [Alkalicoccobacillus plakortidis]|uniref:Amidohydrolase n=1 Tax=Alkalicoccobacillus plakortidis TaxID=444060 RepID=A0ABT0XH90_9BACI|nr:amidohydrolase [Alkalicoccobacillus plakortidis]MCM2675291.1 amidohydrolase [Alkalicoccobacillus plakortidis]
MGTLWHNGTFFTLKQQGEAVDAVYVVDGKIVALGTKETLLQQFKQDITVIKDIKGGYVYPGFVDSHLHMVGHGEKLLSLDLSKATTSFEMREWLVQKAKDSTQHDWVLAEGWNENNFADKKIFHRLELDEISPNKPLYASRVCRHAALVNTEALRRACISRDTPDPQGGVIERDQSGEPTGYLMDAAVDLIKEVMPPVDREYVYQALKRSIEDLLAQGITGGHTEDMNYYNGFSETIDVFQSLIHKDKFRFRTNLLVHHEQIDEMSRLGFGPGPLSDYLEIGSMKIFADGALGGRTALLSEPYSDDPDNSGVAMHSPEALKALVKKARDYHMPVAIHVIGDAALEQAIAAVEEFPPIEGRDRFIHLQVARPDLVNRLKPLQAILDLQPRFVATDFPWVEDRLGPDRLPSSFAWKTLLDAGLHCAGGSDAPIEPPGPLLGMHAAITRRHPDEARHAGYLPEQKLSRFEAIQLFTSGSAYATGHEEKRGFISEGYDADFTVLTHNLFTCDIEEYLSAEVLMTIVDNTIMYKNEEK